MCRNVNEYNTLMRYLLSVVLFSHFQRPSVASNMTLEEFLRAKQASDGRHIILVSEHKTSAQGPAQLALENDHYKLFQLYAKRSVAVQYLLQTNRDLCSIVYHLVVKSCRF